MKHLKVLIVPFLILLVSCTAFIRMGSSVNKGEEMTVTVRPAEVATAAAVGGQTTQVPSSCGIFIPPKFRPIPALPVFTEEEADDPEGVAFKLGAHITQLRDYIRERQKEQGDAYQKYLDNCPAARALNPH